MSTSAYVLFEKGESVPLSVLFEKIKELCEKNNFCFANDGDEFNAEGKLKSTSVYVADKPFFEDDSKQIPWDIYDEPYDYCFQSLSFDWDPSDTEYFKAMISGGFYEEEDFLFKLVYEVLKVYPKAKLKICNNWFYTLEDLEKIAAMPYDNDWCYKNPKELFGRNG